MPHLGLSAAERDTLRTKGRAEVLLGLGAPPRVGSEWRVRGTDLVVRSAGVREETVPGIGWDGQPNAPRHWTLLVVVALGNAVIPAVPAQSSAQREGARGGGV